MQQDPVAQAHDHIEQLAERATQLRAAAAAAPRSIGGDKADIAAASAILSAGGVDLAALERVAAAHEAKRKERRDGVRKAAIERSHADARLLGQRQAAAPHLDPEAYIVLDEVTFLRTFLEGGRLIDSHIAPGDNWARYDFDNDDGSAGRLSFFTLWQNTRNRADITPGAQVSVHAGFSADAQGTGIGGWFGINDYAHAVARLRVTAHALWDPSLTVIAAERELGRVSATGGFFGDDDWMTIVFSEFVSGSAISVPRDGWLMIEVELLIETDALGSIHLDADDGAHRVAISHVILTRS